MVLKKNVPKKIKTVSSVSEESMSVKSSKGGNGSAPNSQWEVLTVTEVDIKSLVAEGFLALEMLSGYRCTLGQDVLAPNTGEIVVFVDFFSHRSIYIGFSGISFVIMMPKCIT